MPDRPSALAGLLGFLVDHGHVFVTGQLVRGNRSSALLAMAPDLVILLPGWTSWWTNLCSLQYPTCHGRLLGLAMHSFARPWNSIDDAGHDVPQSSQGAGRDLDMLQP